MPERHAKYKRLLEQCRSLPPLPVAVAYPCDRGSLQGAVEAAEAGLIAPILVGPRELIEEVAAEHSINIAGLPIEDCDFSEAAAERAVALVREHRSADEGQPAHRRADGAVVKRDTGCAPSAASATASSWTCPATTMR
jgi:phosphate acetyltransferase